MEQTQPEHGTTLWPKDFQNLSVGEQVRYATQLAKQSSYLKRRPFIHSEGNAIKLVEKLRAHSEFCWALSFDPTLIVRLCREGFLPMAGQIFADLICLLPKLHINRCLMPNLNDLKIGSGARKRAKNFLFTIDKATNEVIKGCQAQHGKNCWLYAPLTNAYRYIQQLNSSGGLEGVRIHTCELWDKKSGKLVAGEIGYAIGSIYTSLSGYREPGSKSAGTIQCCCTAIMLKRMNFKIWDLGMGMDYKTALGAKNIPRIDFLTILHSVRDNSESVLSCETKTCCSELVKWFLKNRGDSSDGGSTSSGGSSSTSSGGSSSTSSGGSGSSGSKVSGEGSNRGGDGGKKESSDGSSSGSK
jgi:Leu/Phe-tRNA-protein transferase